MKTALIIIVCILALAFFGYVVKVFIEDWLYERSLSDKEKFMRDGWM